jgi:hypothetical protein
MLGLYLDGVAREKEISTMLLKDVALVLSEDLDYDR